MQPARKNHRLPNISIKKTAAPSFEQLRRTNRWRRADGSRQTKLLAIKVMGIVIFCFHNHGMAADLNPVGDEKASRPALLLPKAKPLFYDASICDSFQKLNHQT